MASSGTSRSRPTNKHRPGFLGLSLILAWALLLSACSPQTPQTIAASSPPTLPPTSPQQTTQPTGQLVGGPTLSPSSPTAQATPSAAPSSPTAAPAQPTSTTLIPDPGTITWTPLTGGLDSPVGLTNAGDGSGRLFVLEQRGRIRIIKNGQLLPTPFLDITDRVGKNGSEQGLLGLVFDPGYKSNSFFYVNYTDENANTVIARFKVSADADVASPASEKVLLHVRQPYPNHKGGALNFGPDGYLYIGLGDGGSEGDPQLTGQNTNTLLGKLLRIDVHNGDPYSIPKDNPFVNGGGLHEIWAYGLRNPWRFSFDRATGDLYIGDVGQDTYEEIDYLPAGSPGGENYGWSFREGFHPYKGTPPAGLKLVDPVWEYDHSQGCAIIGGAVYRGVNLPAWQGVYFYGDYCSGKVWGLKRGPDGTWHSQLLSETGSSITSFGLDEAGEIYLVDQQGIIFHLSGK